MLIKTCSGYRAGDGSTLDFRLSLRRRPMSDLAVLEVQTDPRIAEHEPIL